ncbi:MAG: ribose 5-phosphate isomerase B [Saccharofermentanales bacterium]|jgi:ribose 5-phosphate isomerase B|nr:ribose 5-phosphate isomerase B [Clostridiaceae bacterium]
MRIVIGSDHAGYALKMQIKTYLEAKNYTVIDVGTDSAAESVSYVDYGRSAAAEIVSGRADRGIIVCGSGIGISIAANKVPGIRAALCTNSYMAEMARRHNDANMLALGGRMLAANYAQTIVDAFLTYEFEGGRHQKRLDSLE